QQVAGPRALAMGEVHRGIGSSNDTIFFNPAGMSLFPRYSLELFWRREFVRAGNLFGFSVVDSKSGPVGGGIAYTYEYRGARGELRNGSRLDVSASYRIANFLLIGTTVRYVGMGTADGDVSRVTGDTGLLFVLGDWLFFGLSGHNVVNPAETAAVAPRTFGGGLSVVAGHLQVGFDYQISAERDGTPDSYYVGAEYFAFGFLALRAGYVLDHLYGESRWTAGLGYVSPDIGVDLAYSQTIAESGVRAQYLSLGLRFFR
ncbi:MAG: hypothetical protein D6729_07175, partial [Deltaproteobacteria bacterium]